MPVGTNRSRPAKLLWVSWLLLYLAPTLPQSLILVYLAVGGAIGTLARYGLGTLITGFAGNAFPWGTLAINVAGSFLLGLVAAVADRSLMSPEMRTVLGVGFCGAFTTFSTFGLETVTLLRDGQAGRAVAYAGVSLVVGLLAVLAGLRVGG